MMQSRIIYIGFYDNNSSLDKRYISQSSKTKMDYIASSLNRGGKKVHFVSPAWITDSNTFFRIIFQQTIIINNTQLLTKCPSISSKFRLVSVFNRYISLAWLFFWLLFNTEKNEKILIYHSPFYAIVINYIKRLKNLEIVLEVEETYSEVWDVSESSKKREHQLLNIADYYIAVSNELAKKLGKKTKAVVYGNYNISDHLDSVNLDYTPTINVIYAGTLDLTRGGAINSVRVASVLPNNYTVHICGSGTELEIKELLKEIDQINISKGRTVCIYHGFLTGVELINLIKKCHIAINPQKSGVYMDSAFPSKIVFYLTNKLSVVSSAINSIKESPFAQFIEFSADDSIKSFADAVQRINVNKRFEIDLLFKELDDEFVKNIAAIFNSPDIK